MLICKETRNLVNEESNITKSRFNTWGPSKLKNDPCFKDNRHDQSIFSLLTKKYNL